MTGSGAIVRGLAAAALCWTAMAPAAPGARAACIAAVVVDGHLLVGQGLSPAAERALPPRLAARAAVSPACNDAGQDDPDGQTRVQPLRGIPASVAVVDLSWDELFLARGSLVGIASHPLHRTIALRRRRAPLRGCQASTSTLRGVLAQDATASGLVLRGAGRSLRVDEQAQLLRRPAWTPLLRGQRVELAVSECGSRRTVRSISTVGRLVEPELVAARTDQGVAGRGPGRHRRAAVIGALLALGVVTAVAAGRHAGRPSASR